MKIKISSGLFSLVVLIVAACSVANKSNQITKANDPDWKVKNAHFLFNQDVLHTFELTLAEDSLQFLENDPGSPGLSGSNAEKCAWQLMMLSSTGMRAV